MWKKPLLRPRRKWENNVEITSRKTIFTDKDWSVLVHNNGEILNLQ
jgi:hypothetical protein